MYMVPMRQHKGRMASVAYQSWGRGERCHCFLTSPRRDFVYVKDVVEANIFAATQDVERDWYDVGTGQANTFQSLVECMGK